MVPRDLLPKILRRRTLSAQRMSPLSRALRDQHLQFDGQAPKCQKFDGADLQALSQFAYQGHSSSNGNAGRREERKFTAGEAHRYGGKGLPSQPFNLFEGRPRIGPSARQLPSTLKSAVHLSKYLGIKDTLFQQWNDDSRA
jgi:hypothetical protein